MKYKITLHGKVYEVEVERGEAMIAAEYDAVAPVPAAAPVATAAVAATPVAAAPAAAPVAVGDGEPVVSPMPGNILQIKVTAGQTVKSGELLIVLEAMKMENEIVAPRDATVKQVVTAKGAVVNTGDTLIVLA